MSERTKVKIYLVCDDCLENIKEDKTIKYEIIDQEKRNIYLKNYWCCCSEVTGHWGEEEPTDPGELCDYCSNPSGSCYMSMELIKVFL